MGCSVASAALLLGHAATGAEPATRYTVKPGDTLYGLASRYLLATSDYRTVQRRNHIANPRRLRVGAQLVVPASLLRTAPVAAQLGAYRGEVTISGAGGPLSVAPGVTIPEGAVISTGPNSFARLDFPDRSRLALPSQSRVRITRLRQTLLTNAVDREFTVEAGRSESSVTHLPTPQDRYIVRTPVSVSAVRGTEFRVSYEAGDHRASTEVIGGTVAVNAEGGPTTLVQASYGVSATPQDSKLAPHPLPATPTLQRPGDVQDEPKLSFDVEPSPGARTYHAQLAMDAGFLDLFAETTSPTPHFDFDGLADGTYFVRVSAIDDSLLESPPATYAFERVLNTLDAAKTPVMNRDDRRRLYLFRWDVGGDGTRVYRFQLSRDGGGPAPVIDSVGLTDRQLTVTDLPPGSYSWRVMSRTFNHGRYVDKWSATQTFTIGD
jgi:hypothetical protein